MSDFKLKIIIGDAQIELEGEGEWMLVYALYASNCGKDFFSKENLHAKYEETNRVTQSRNNHFMENLKILLTSKYISGVNQTDFRLEQTGIQTAKAILSRTSESQNRQKLVELHENETRKNINF